MTRRGLKAAGLLWSALALVACGDGGDADTAATTPATTAAAAASTLPGSDPVADSVAEEEAVDTSEAEVSTTVRISGGAGTVPATEETTTTEAATTTVDSAPAPSLEIVPAPTLPQPVAPPPPRAAEAHVELGTIEIPKIGIVKPLLEGISLNTLDKGPGHWPGTAMPGQPGNVVVAGHRTSKDRPFRHIDQLVPGDEVVFNTADGRFVYLVTGTEIVLPDAMWIVGQTPASTATLFACHPVGSTRERIVVFLQLQA